jgi:RHS repeat-associated protein
MKTTVRILLLVVFSATVLFGQHPPNCDSGCGTGTTTPGTGADPMLTSTSITNARGTGNSLVAAQQTGRSKAIEGSQSYTYAVNLFSLPGRNGLNLNLTLYYNSMVWEYNSDNNSMVYGGFDSPSPGFRLDYGLVQFATDVSLGILTEPSGAKHLFVPTSMANQFTTQDSSYILVQYPASAGNPVIVTYKDGLRVLYQVFDTTYPYQYRPYQLEDTNGNILAIAYQDSNSLRINTITDTVGRVIRFTYDSATGTMLQSVAQLNSIGQVFRQYSFSWTNQVINFNFTRSATAGLGLPPGYLTSGQTTENLLAGVTRPDGTKVAFAYVHDLNGVNVDNPDWGVVKSIQEQSSSGTPRYTTSYLFPAASAGALTSNPTYTQQVVYDGVNTGTWNFQATKTIGTLRAPAMVTCFATLDPLGRLSTTTFASNSGALNGLPVQEKTSSTSQGTSFSGCQTTTSQTWRTVNQSWTTDIDGSNARLTSATTVVEDGTTQSQIKFNSYDSFGQVTDLLQYDFGAGLPGPLLREAVTTYASLANNIVTRLSEIKIKDGGGNLVTDTKFHYDEGTIASVSPLPISGTHDETNYSSSSTNARGNLTSEIHYANATAGTGGITSTFTHDELGNTLTSSTGSGPQTVRTFSSTTQYAYPDSISVGGLSTSFTYDMDRGTIASVTDPNGQITNFTADIDSRPSTVTSPDGIISTTTYDDAGAYAAVSTSSTANSLVAKMTADGRAHLLSQQILNGASPISTTGFTNDVAGQLLQVTNPYGPSDSIVNTTYTYDPLGRALSATPPAIGIASQNAYQTQYTAGTFTDSAGNTRSGQIVTTTDPAGKQRKQYLDALGRVVRVDEPGQTGGSVGAGSVSITGGEQSVSVQNGGSATAGTGSVTIAGTERSTVVRTHNATTASINVTIGGADTTNTFITCAPNGRCFSHNSPDAGTIQFSVAIGGTTVGPVQVTYGGTSTTASLAAALFAAFPANSLVTMSNPNGSSSFTLTTAATGSATNSAIFTDALVSGCDTTSDFWACAGVGWTMTLSGPNLTPTTAVSANLTGGSDNVDTTFYDTGTVTVNVTINGTVYSKASNYSQTTTAAGIASDLASKINTDATLNQLLVASAASNVLNLTTTATGSNTADPLSTGAATTSQYFTAGSSSFTATPSGATLTPGQNGVVFDAGTVTVSIAGFTATPRNYTANYSQGSTTNTIASAILGAINADSLAPVTASVASGSNVVALTAKTTGSDTNYGVTASSATSQGTYFSQPSFSGSGTALSGGTDSTASLDTPLSTFSGYNAMGRLLQVTQGQQTRTYQYDSLQRLTSACVPERNNQCNTYTYKDFGALATKIDPRSITTTYTYDTLSRLQTITYSDSTPTVTYTYGALGTGNNAVGRLINVSSSSATEAYTYDTMGRITRSVKTIGAKNYTTSYHYTNGQLDSITYPSGRIVSQDHDAVGRLSQVRTGGVTVLSIGSYNAANEILTMTYGSGMTATYTYNNQLQLASILTSNTSTTVMNLSYSYGGANDNGQISGITDGVNSSRSTSYVYDELGRLRTAQTTDLTSANTWKLKFSYDRYGNRLSEIPVAGTAVMPMNEVVVDPTTNRLANLAYDADGNVVNDSLHTYAYDALNQITSADGTSNTYAYDAGGLRVNKNGAVYIYSGGQPTAVYTGGAASTSPSVEFIYVGGRRVARIDSGVLSYIYDDHLSPRVETDSTGAVVRTLGDFPYGESWYSTGSSTSWQFTTYEHDAESGLDYADARHYSSRFGRFTSLDPLSGDAGDPQSRNRYPYAMNDPINHSDPTGLLASKWDMCLYDDLGNPTRCFGLPTESKEMTDGEQLFDLEVLLTLIQNNCPGPCSIGVNADSDPNIVNALNDLAASYGVDVVWVDISVSNPPALPGFSANFGANCKDICFTVGSANIWNCFTSVSCDPRKFMQPAVSRSLGIPQIPTRRMPPSKTTAPSTTPAIDGEGIEQLEPIPPELLIPLQYGLYGIANPSPIGNPW